VGIGRKKLNQFNPPRLNNTYLKDRLLANSVKLSALQIYSRTLIDPNVIALLTGVINSMTNLILDCIRIRTNLAESDPDWGDKNLILIRNYNELDRLVNTVPELAAMQKNVDDKTLFTALTERISEKQR
jgi:hypothetical protein